VYVGVWFFIDSPNGHALIYNSWTLVIGILHMAFSSAIGVNCVPNETC
jgi:hypothetical protein